MEISRPRRAGLPGLLGLGAFWLLVTLACRGPERTVGGEPTLETLERRDLAAALDRKEIRLEVAAIDFGQPRARRHLLHGWSWDERQGDSTFAWGIGASSAVEFHLGAPRDVAASLAGHAFRFPGAPPQHVAVELNGRPIARFEVGPSLGEHGFTLPAEALTAGRNELVLRYAYHRRPAEVMRSNDRRPLAVAWKSLRFAGVAAAAAPRALIQEGMPRLFVPFGSSVSYHFELAGADAVARLEVGDLRFRGQGRLEVIWRAASGAAAVAAQTLAPGAGAATPWYGLPEVQEPNPVRLSLRAIATSGASPETGAGRGVVLEAPVLHLRAPRHAAAPAAPDRSSSADRGEGARYNVVLYLVDTLRADRLGAHGASPSPSPHLDRFAADAVLFENAYAQTSWTKPAIASIFTGLGPLVHNVHDPVDALPSEALTLAEILGAAGYRSAGFVTNAHLRASSGLAQGFEHWDYRFDVPADELVAPAMAWLDRLADEPFFLYVHTIDPHAPYAPRSPFRERFAAGIDDPRIGTVEHIRSLPGRGPPSEDPETAALLKLYDAEIAQNDAAFGAFLGALGERGLDERTIVVFLSDHGEAFREHGVLGHGWDLYGETLEVPWIMRWPGGPRGVRIAAAVQHVDLLPTLLGLVDLPLPAGLDGRDLTPLLAGGEIAPTPLFSHLDYEGRRGMSVVYRNRKLIEPLGGGFARRRELYRLDQDPMELDDRALLWPVWASYLGSLAQGELSRGDGALEARRDVIDEARRRELEALGYLR